MKKVVLLMGLVAMGIALSGCKKTDKKLQGLWQITSVSLDNQDPYTVQKTESNSICGDVKYTVTVKYSDVYLSFTKDEQYQLSYKYTRISSATPSNSNCNSEVDTSEYYTTEVGYWTAVGKDKIYLQPMYGKPYECNVTVKKQSMKLDCAINQEMSFYVGYGQSIKATISSMQLEGTKLDK